LKKDEANVLCNDYWYDFTKGQGMNTIVAVLVAVINIILRYTTEFFVNLIGFDTESERVSTIMSFSFIAAFINTAIVTLLTNANFQYMEFPFFIIPLRLQYTDLNRDWYVVLGPAMVKTILIASLAPVIEIISAIITRFIKHTIDSGFPCCPRYVDFDDDEEVLENPDDFVTNKVRKTKKTTVFQYVELYAGPVYLPHSKYSQLMVIICVAFTYGAFLPALWIVTLIAICIFMFLEVYMLAYVYRQPPSLDAALDSKANVILRYSPLFTFAVGYWALSSPQMF
jgi:hypothetical protein